MTDPFTIFASASPSKQQMLATVWPQLYACLARLEQPKAAHTVSCVINQCVPRMHIGPVQLAVGRLSRLGPPACQRHVDMLADRPGGWPLDINQQSEPEQPAPAAPGAARPRAFWEE